MTTTLEPPATAPAASAAFARARPRGWERPALLALLATTAVLYLWGLGESGWANSFYSAAAQAGSESWKAFFYGSSDAANSITVDKTPASLWVMALSVRVFGLSSWSILVPQALMGVGAVGLLHATVKRWSGPVAGLIAGAVLALTPVAVLMFRFNNPDALLVLLLVAAAYATVRATERASARWLVLAGALVGFGFLTKMLQALLVVPAFALAYLVAAPTTVRRRIGHLLAAGLALLVSAGWWVAIVELAPASARPYIGGSQDNSILELVLGYNGFGRLTGNETGSVGGAGGGGTGMWGETGWSRLFDAEVGGQVAWLLPAALILLAAGLVMTRRRYRTDRTRAALLLWGGWLLVTGLTFSFMAGIFHAYYTVALAPAIGALIGIGAVELWRRRAMVPLALTLAVTAGWSYVLLKRSGDFLPWLAPTVLVVGMVVAVGLLAARRRVAVVLAAAGLLVALAGPAAYAVDTAASPHTGSIPSAGPALTGARGGPGGGFRGGAGGQAPQGGTGGFGGGPGGGLLNGSTASSQMVTLLEANADDYTWVAATVGSNNASGYQLATGEPVMAIGGFNGTDPSPTLAEFQQYVAAGKIHYFIADGTGGGTRTGGSAAAQEIASWVAENFTATTVDGVTVYDLGS
jgi:4-amino-4-deoxy-L-arabinose transferase-like glycosyltransferase